jgi:DNA-binding NtrC family response regulator
MSKIRVLLVDDEEDYVKALAERMNMRDVRTSVALSGEEALRTLAEDPPEVMVLDLRMPGMQGMEVLEVVRKHHPQIQVIILTGHGGEKEEKEARRLGAFEYVQKPADIGHLVGLIQGAWRKGIEVTKEFIRESEEEFSRSMAAAAMAEGGMQDEAAEMLSKKKPAKEEPPKVGLKVLLVDDEEDYVSTMAERMEMREVGSSVALNGEAALAMVEEDLPDVMVLDLKMPGMGGLEVLERMKQTHPEIPVIILTGHGSAREEEEARRLGAFDYLEKPIDINDLLDAITRAGRTES